MSENINERIIHEWIWWLLLVLWTCILFLGLIFYSNCPFRFAYNSNANIALHRIEEGNLFRLEEELFFRFCSRRSWRAIGLLTFRFDILLWRCVKFLGWWDYIANLSSCKNRWLMCLCEDVKGTYFLLTFIVRLHTTQSDSSILTSFKTTFIHCCVLHVSSNITILANQITFAILRSCVKWIQFYYAFFAY